MSKYSEKVARRLEAEAKGAVAAEDRPASGTEPNRDADTVARLRKEINVLRERVEHVARIEKARANLQLMLDGAMAKIRGQKMKIAELTVANAKLDAEVRVLREAARLDRGTIAGLNEAARILSEKVAAESEVAP